MSKHVKETLEMIKLNAELEIQQANNILANNPEYYVKYYTTGIKAKAEDTLRLVGALNGLLSGDIPDPSSTEAEAVNLPDHIKKIGTPNTVGQLQHLLSGYGFWDSFGFRNQPMQSLYEVTYDNTKHIVFDN